MASTCMLNFLFDWTFSFYYYYFLLLKIEKKKKRRNFKPITDAMYERLHDDAAMRCFRYFSFLFFFFLYSKQYYKNYFCVSSFTITRSIYNIHQKQGSLKLLLFFWFKKRILFFGL